MTLGIMQPYFMPYLGYFALIKHVDQFILFDTPQFIRHGWIERNKVLKQNGETLYIKVPLEKHPRNTPINEVVIKNDENWKNKILAQLVPYKKKAPYYKEVIGLLEAIFETETDSIVKLNALSLHKFCNYLDISTPIKIWSEMKVKIDTVNASDEWALNICKAMGANSYFNPPNGKEFFDSNKYFKAGIELKFLEINQTPYNQYKHDFVPYLSIIDVLMFNDKELINQMLNQLKITND
ncbi:MAG: WbqC family protein [Flavobacteriaceae bacterium]